jgi:Zn-dependent peptidase ImmA (M78 family)
MADDMSQTTNPQIEAEANYFAMCLLMPRDLLVEEFEKVRGMELEEAVELLAKKFQVSAVRMAVRLGQLELIR